MRTKQGVITSAKMKDTVTVTVHRHEFHPVYKKRFRVSKKFLADSKGMDLWVGDLVEIAECRPISKRKHFRVTQVLKAAPRVDQFVEEANVAAVLQREEKAPKKTAKKSSSSAEVPAGAKADDSSDSSK